MKLHQVVQGSPEWLALRKEFYTASELPTAAGENPHKSRNELLTEKVTGITKEVDWRTQERLDNGHRTEALARPIAEAILGESLFAVTASATIDEIPLLASCDGITMNGKTLFEHKDWNKELVAAMARGDVLHHRLQLDQQLLVTGAERVLFMCSDGTEQNCKWVWYDGEEGMDRRVILTWRQFIEDMKTFVPAEVVAPVVGRTMENLPALHIEVQGMVTASNLAQYKEAAIALISGVSTDLQTDQDFADAEKAVKWAKDIEERLDAAKSHALGQTASIDELFRTLDAIKAEARDKRLLLEKLVKSRKEQIRSEAVAKATSDWMAFVKKVNQGLGAVWLPEAAAQTPDFGGAIKGKKSVKGIEDAIAEELARAKIEAHQMADHIRTSVEILRTEAAGYEDLFADAKQLAVKPHDDLRAAIKVRVSEFKQREEARLERERAAMREQAEREVRQKVEAERLEEATRLAREVRQKVEAEQREEVAEAQAPKAVSVVTEASPKAEVPAPAVRGKRMEPTADEIIRVLAGHYQTEPVRVAGWLATMDFTTFGARKAASSF